MRCKTLALMGLVSLVGAADVVAQCAWEYGPTFPGGARKLATAVNQNGTLIVIGGRPLVGGEAAPVHSLASGAMSWTSETPIDLVLFQPGAGLDPSGAIIVVGGWSFDDTGPGFFVLTGAFFYDPATGEGGAVASMPCSRSFFGFAEDSQNRFYVISGLDRFGNSQLITDCVERYDPIADSWEAIAPLPAARENPAAAYDGNGHILVFGGANAIGTSQSTTFSFDIAAGTWSTLAPQPAALQSQSAALGADGNVYVAGGFASNSNFPVSTVYVFDPLAVGWSVGPSLNTARQGTAMARDDDGFIWVLGGSGNVGTDTTEKLDTSPPAIDCNSNGIPDECETDCNTNDIPDDCDITSGFSPDLNFNGVPDECDECVFDTDCTDGISCTSDTCQAVTAVCVFPPDHGACDDGNACTTDVCDPITGDPTTGCLNTAVNIDDGVGCTVDACDAVTGAVTHTPDNTACNDNAECTVDTCHLTNDCQFPPDHAACLDSSACTTDTCDPLTGDPTTGCVNTAVDVDDGVDCTVDACDSVTGVVSHTPDHVFCDNDLFCDGAEECDSSLDCQAGIAPCLPKDCNETTDTCNQNIPTVSQWGVVCMTLLVLVTGTVVFQRRLGLD